MNKERIILCIAKKLCDEYHAGLKRGRSIGDSEYREIPWQGWYMDAVHLYRELEIESLEEKEIIISGLSKTCKKLEEDKEYNAELLEDRDNKLKEAYKEIEDTKKELGCYMELLFKTKNVYEELEETKKDRDLYKDLFFQKVRERENEDAEHK